MNRVWILAAWLFLASCADDSSPVQLAESPPPHNQVCAADAPDPTAPFCGWVITLPPNVHPNRRIE